jgi:hypothetical protein
MSHIDSPPQKRIAQTRSCPQGTSCNGCVLRLILAIPNNPMRAATASNRYGIANLLVQEADDFVNAPDMIASVESDLLRGRFGGVHL